jgi:hypothetical protein
LTPLTNKVVDSLTSEWLKEGVKGVGSEVQDKLKGTALGKSQQTATKSGESFEPAAMSTWQYATQITVDLKARTVQLKEVIDAIVRNGMDWSVPAATTLYKSFHKYCRYLTDAPDLGFSFKEADLHSIELNMWKAWALARNESYWRNTTPEDIKRQGKLAPLLYLDDTRDMRVAMQPILARLRVLKVADHVVIETDVGGRIGSRKILDVVKMIEWANKSQPLPKAA